ncbi:unnamed protein product, partial [Didymodactylos carnosus]
TICERVQFPVGPTFITEQPSQILYYINHGTLLTCQAIAEPPPSIIWLYKNGTNDEWLSVENSSSYITLFKNGSLFIKPFKNYVRTIHSGCFKCVAENVAGSIHTNRINLKPQIYDVYEIEVKNAYGYEHSSVILSCEVSSFATPYIQIIGWLSKENEQIVELSPKPFIRYNMLPNNNLIIHNISKVDNLSYACLVRNRITNESRRSEFKMLKIRDFSPFGPELIISNGTEYMVNEGDTVEIPCAISLMSSRSKLTWYKNGNMINMSSQSQQYRSFENSIIFQTSADDNGNYLCRNEDDLGNIIIFSSILKVQSKIRCEMIVKEEYITADSAPFIIHSHQHQDKRIVKLNSQIDINCTLYGDPIPDIEWIIDGETIISKNGSTKQQQQHILPSGDVKSTLSINVNDKTDTGLYECKGRNQYGSTLLRVSVNLDGPPYIRPLKNVTIKYNEYISIPCYASGHPSPHLTWIQGFVQSADKFDNVTSSTSPALLTKSNLTKSDFYSCVADSAAGRTIENVFVSVIIPAKIVSKPLNITTIKNRTIYLTCTAQGDYPLTLTMTRQRSTPQQTHHFDIKRTKSYETKSNTTKNITVEIKRVNIDDSGIYTCIAQNLYSNDHTVFYVNVQDVPRQVSNVQMAFLSEDHNKISWNTPFNGHSQINAYVINIQQQTVIGTTIYENKISVSSDTTTYDLYNLTSKCSYSITIYAVNSIGNGIPSDILHFATKAKKINSPPINIIITNISSSSLTINWQNPTIIFCYDPHFEYLIKIWKQDNDSYHQIIHVKNYTFLHNRPTNVYSTFIKHLNSYTTYLITIQAINEFGIGPIPHAIIKKLSAKTINTTTILITWSAISNESINGQFRTFSITYYYAFDLSTMKTIETIENSIIVTNLYEKTTYIVFVSVCNSFDCGTPSKSIIVSTRNSNSVDNNNISIVHPKTKPLQLDCISENTLQKYWLFRNKPINETADFIKILPNNSLLIMQPQPFKNDGEYQCQSHKYDVMIYDKPSTAKIKLHYITTNTIGLKFNYLNTTIPIQGIIVSFMFHNSVEKVYVFPPSTGVRLENLKCGSQYEIFTYTENDVGTSMILANETLLVKTDGFVPSTENELQFIKAIYDTYLELNLTFWIANGCSIEKYGVKLQSILNAAGDRYDKYFSYFNDTKSVNINDLTPDTHYELTLIAENEAGNSNVTIRLRTYPLGYFTKDKLPKLEMLLGQKRLKPVAKRTHSLWMETDNEFTIKTFTNDHQIKETAEYSNRPYSFVSEDSQGNINPYAVIDLPNKKCIVFDNNPGGHLPTPPPSERFFRPIVLKSSISSDDISISSTNQSVIQRQHQLPSLLQQQERNQTYFQSYQPSSVLSTISASQAELCSAFYLPNTSQNSFIRRQNDRCHCNNTKMEDHLLFGGAVQQCSSADSGVHSSTQSPISKQQDEGLLHKCYRSERLTPRRCPTNEQPFRHSTQNHHRPYSTTGFDESKIYAAYDEQFSLLRRANIQLNDHVGLFDHHHQYSLV